MLTEFDQLFVLLFAAIFFSILYEVSRQTKRPQTWAGIFASGFWLVLGLLWFVLASDTYVVGLLWNGVGILYIVRWMIDLVSMRSLSRRLGDEG